MSIEIGVNTHSTPLACEKGFHLFYRPVAPLEQRDGFRDQHFFTPEA